MKVLHPTTGKLIELPEAHGSREDGVFHVNTQDAKGFTAKGASDGVLRLDDRPDGISESDWRAYLIGLAEWAEIVPQARVTAERLKALAKTVGDQSSSIGKRLSERAHAGTLEQVAAQLEPYGLRLERGGGDWAGTPHFTVIGGRGAANFIPVGSDDPPEAVVLRALLADGRLPEVAQTFIAALPESLRAACTRLLDDGAIHRNNLEFGGQPVDLIRQRAGAMNIRNNKLEIMLNGGTHHAPRGTLMVEVEGDLLKLSVLASGRGQTMANAHEYFLSAKTPLDRPIREGMRPRF